MSFSIRCPHCTSRLTAKSNKVVGKQMPCPKCKQVFTVTPLPPSTESQEAEEFDLGSVALSDFDLVTEQSYGGTVATPQNQGTEERTGTHPYGSLTGVSHPVSSPDVDGGPSTNTIDFQLDANSIDLPLDDADSLLQSIEGRFRSYLAGLADHVESGNLAVAVVLRDRAVGDEDDRVTVKLAVKGVLDGKAIEYESEVDRSVPTPHANRRRMCEAESAATFATSGILGLVVRRLIFALFPGSRQRQPKRKHLNEMVSQTSNASLRFIDKIIDRPATANLRRWNVLRITAVVASIILLPLWGLFGEGRIALGLLAVVPMFAVFFSIAMLLMPADFYANEAAGQKLAASKREAVKSAVLVILLAGGMIVGIVCMAVFIR